MLASRASTWSRDRFCRSTIAPRLSWPTMWNEFLSISTPITAIALLSFYDMLEFGAPCQLLSSSGAGVRPDHPITERKAHGFAKRRLSNVPANAPYSGLIFAARIFSGADGPPYDRAG
jgi:hypothetical protein